MIEDLQAYLDILRAEDDLAEIDVEVDPHLEVAEIHRRVIAAAGPALLFKNVRGAKFPLATNLFGTKKRVELSFGARPERLIRELAALPHTLLPPTLGKLWNHKGVLKELIKVGSSTSGNGAVKEVIESTPQLDQLPLLTTWEKDGGPFITLPLVYTEHPETHIPNLGMYRLQRYNNHSTGLHFQIGKGGGFHLDVAQKLNQRLPVSVIIGGAPALMLAAIAPLPENVPELLLASLVLGKRLKMTRHALGPHAFPGNAEFVLVGEADPNERQPEGPFGDHYGYYSLKHDYPVFKCKGVLRKKNPIFTATVVGKPRQEDFFLGDYLQELLSPIFPIVMPAVKDLWAYGETGYHSLACAVVHQRYKREAMVSAFRILGEGQLSLTKFLLVIDRKIDIRDFKSTLEHVLERCDFRSDLYVFSNLAMDTLDYTGPRVNEGSKGILLGVGDPIRKPPAEFHGTLPVGVTHAKPFCRGCLVVDGPSFHADPQFGDTVVQDPAFSSWPLIVLVDDAKRAVLNSMSFLWTTFTRFEPGADIKAKRKEILRNHISYSSPILIDARMKPSYPEELFCDERTAKLVDSRWREYFPKGLGE